MGPKCIGRYLDVIKFECVRLPTNTERDLCLALTLLAIRNASMPPAETTSHIQSKIPLASFCVVFFGSRLQSILNFFFFGSHQIQKLLNPSNWINPIIWLISFLYFLGEHLHNKCSTMCFFYHKKRDESNSKMFTL